MIPYPHWLCCDKIRYSQAVVSFANDRNTVPVSWRSNIHYRICMFCNFSQTLALKILHTKFTVTFCGFLLNDALNFKRWVRPRFLTPMIWFSSPRCTYPLRESTEHVWMPGSSDWTRWHTLPTWWRIHSQKGIAMWARASTYIHNSHCKHVWFRITNVLK